MGKQAYPHGIQAAAEMQTDIGGRADAFAGAIDMHLPAKERRFTVPVSGMSATLQISCLMV